MEWQGLPVHILLLHGAVILAPVTGIVGIVYACWARVRRILVWPLGVGAVATAALAVLTAHFGEELERALPKSDLIESHAAYGDVFKYMALAFLLAAGLAILVTERGLARRGALSWLARPQGNVWLGRASRVLLVLAAIILLVVTYLTGHSGATAVWHDWRTHG